MSTEPQPDRRVTWIGVVVILAIFGLVGGLTLAVLPRVREKARREECAKHLKDIGHAVHDFHDAYGYLPTAGSWSDHGIGYDAANQPLTPKYQTAGWPIQILPFLELDGLYRTSDVLYSIGRPMNLKPLGPQGTTKVPTPFPDDYAPRNSYYIDLTVGLAGPARGTPFKVYYCPSRRPTNVYSWNQIGLTDYTAVAPGMVPMSRDTSGNFNEDTGGLIYGWSRAEGGTNGQPGFNDWQYGRHHGVIPGGNWGNQQHKHTFDSITMGAASTMMIGEKFLPPSQYSGGSGGDQLGPFSGAGADTVRTSATGLPWPGESAPRSVGHVNPSRDSDDVDPWVFTMGFGSAHPDGINAVFADGAVHRIRYGIDAEVFNSLGNMNTCLDPFDPHTRDWE